MKQLFIKVCGMRDAENIRSVVALDVDCLGFVFFTRSPRFVSETSENIETISNCCKNKAGVFVNESLDNILYKAMLFRLQFIQLHGNESPEICNELRQNGYFIIKSFSVASLKDFHHTEKYRYVCDYFLFDTKCTSYGGSGNRFDWSLLMAYQDTTPFVLSGGLSPDCVNDIKRLQHPQFAGIDLNSGFEVSPAMKDAGLLKNFINEIKK